MYLLYNLVLTLLSPLWVPWMLWRSYRRREKPNWQERTGNLPLEGKNAPPRIWLHAVSVGEVIAAVPILTQIRRVLPDHQIVLSVTTSSGHQTARELDPKPFDSLIYFPIDVARFQLIAMQRVRPKAVVLMETELWFNFLWAAKVFDAQTILVNGRISDRSFPRSMKIRFFYQSLLKNLDLALMQSELDRERISELGAARAKVIGSSKFDQAIEGVNANPTELRKKYRLPEGAKVLVIGSTRGEPEEEIILEAISKVWGPELFVIHAPRHLEGVPRLVGAVKAKLGESNVLSDPQRTRYQVVDSYGLLSSLYAVADITIVGGGFENLGGQNIIQPLAHGKPVLHGPYMQNFRDSTALADRVGAALVCRNSEELADQLEILLTDEMLRQEMSAAAKKLVQENLGASRRYAEEIAHLLQSQSPGKKVS